MSEPNRIKKNAEVLCLLQASINLVSAGTAIRAAGEMDAHVQLALKEVDQAIQRRLHGRGGAKVSKHICRGYWIDEKSGQFRCYDCGYQRNLNEMEPDEAEVTRPRIEHWEVEK